MEVENVSVITCKPSLVRADFLVEAFPSFMGLWTVPLTISRNVPERSGDLEGELCVLEVRFHVAVLQLHLQSGFPLINYRSCH